MKNSTAETKLPLAVRDDLLPPMPKIVYIVSMFPCWSETFIAEEIQELVDRGLDIDIFSLSTAREDQVHALSRSLLTRVAYMRSALALGSSHLYFLRREPLKYIKTLSRTLRAALSARLGFAKFVATFVLAVHFGRIAQMRRTTHIHAHWATYPTTAAWVINALTGIKYSFTTHAHDLYLRDSLLPEKIDRASFVITISEFNRALLDTIRPLKDRYHVVHCGVDVERFARTEGYNGDARRILSVGRLASIKGFDVLVDACRILKERNIPFFCDIVGDGPLRSELAAQIERNQLQNEVKLIGFADQEDIHRMLAESSLFVLACKESKGHDRDGIPVALMEAMAMSLPVVSTYLSGIPELIVDNVSGVLVPPEDSISLAAAIMGLLANPDVCERLGTEARNTIAAHFNVKLNAERLHELMVNNICQRS